MSCHFIHFIHFISCLSCHVMTCHFIHSLIYSFIHSFVSWFFRVNNFVHSDVISLVFHKPFAQSLMHLATSICIPIGHWCLLGISFLRHSRALLVPQSSNLPGASLPFAPLQGPPRSILQPGRGKGPSTSAAAWQPPWKPGKHSRHVEPTPSIQIYTIPVSWCLPAASPPFAPSQGPPRSIL